MVATLSPGHNDQSARHCDDCGIRLDCLDRAMSIYVNFDMVLVHTQLLGDDMKVHLRAFIANEVFAERACQLPDAAFLEGPPMLRASREMARDQRQQSGERIIFIPASGSTKLRRLYNPNRCNVLRNWPGLIAVKCQERRRFAA